MAIFEDSYFEGEEREGFYIESMMKRTWAAQIDVLEKVGAVCDKYGLRYFADSGTLLGAIRHKGYIPWDDDIDITMFREDYEKLIAIVPKEFPENYCIRDARIDEGYSGIFSRITNSREVEYNNPQFMRRNHGCPYSIGIDIFVLDELPMKKEEEELQRQLLTICLLLKIEILAGKVIDEEMEDSLCWLESVCNIKFSRGIQLAHELQKLGDTICQLYNHGNGTEVTCMYWYAAHGEYRFKKEWYRDSILMPFENIMIPVPVDYDKILTVAYGADYMTPMRGVGAGHDYPHYKGQQEQWESYEVKMVLQAVLGADGKMVSDICLLEKGRQISIYSAACQSNQYRVSVPIRGESEKIVEQLHLGVASEIEEVLYINAEKGYCVERYRASN